MYDLLEPDMVHGYGSQETSTQTVSMTDKKLLLSE